MSIELLGMQLYQIRVSKENIEKEKNKINSLLMDIENDKHCRGIMTLFGDRVVGFNMSDKLIYVTISDLFFRSHPPTFTMKEIKYRLINIVFNHSNDQQTFTYEQYDD